MSTYGSRLQAALERKKASKTDLAKAIGRTPQAVGQVINGATKALTAENNSLAAIYLGVNPHWLATGEGEMVVAGGRAEASNVSPAQLRARVPLINWVQAGNWAEIEPSFCLGEDSENWHEIYNGRPGVHAFALVVEGDSMTSPYPGERSFPPGTIIVVDPDRGTTAGDYVVAKDIATQKATFKRLAHDGGRWYLKPLNPSYPVIEIDDPAIRVIGRVVEFSISGTL